MFAKYDRVNQPIGIEYELLLKYIEKYLGGNIPTKYKKKEGRIITTFGQIFEDINTEGKEKDKTNDNKEIKKTNGNKEINEINENEDLKKQMKLMKPMELMKLKKLMRVIRLLSRKKLIKIKKLLRPIIITHL